MGSESGSGTLLPVLARSAHLTWPESRRLPPDASNPSPEREQLLGNVFVWFTAKLTPNTAAAGLAGSEGGVQVPEKGLYKVLTVHPQCNHTMQRYGLIVCLPLARSTRRWRTGGQVRPGGGRVMVGGGRLSGVGGGERVAGAEEEGMVFSKEQVMEEDEGRLGASPTGRVQTTPLLICVEGREQFQTAAPRGSRGASS